MYLTRFDLNGARRSTRALLASPQKLHAAVAAAFPPSADGDRALWRVDPFQHKATLYLVSPSRPDLTHLVEQAGWPAAEQGWLTRDYTPLLDKLHPGEQWQFRLTANPTHAHRPDGAARSKRYGHVTAAQQTDWLLARAGAHGFAVADDGRAVQATRREVVRFAHRGGAPVTLTRVTYNGILEVTDPAALRRALTGGIGPAKAYGCGLLTLAPNRNG